MSHEQGVRTEQFVLERLRDSGFSCEWIDTWFDITCGSERVEIKSTHLYKRSGFTRAKKPKRAVGQFNFRDDETRATQRAENIWYAFVLVHREQCLLLGFQRANVFPDKPYLSWVEASRYSLLSIEEFRSRCEMVKT